ncbi:anti-sigma factor family protein [candidate division KSB1 bacterium]
MNCNEIREIITPYIDHELEDDTRFKVKSHLEQCTECNNEYKTQSGIKTLLSDKLEKVSAPSELKDQIETLITNEGGREVKNVKPLIPFFRPLISFAAAAVFLLGIVLGSSVLNVFDIFDDKTQDNTYLSTIVPQISDGVSASVVGKVVCIGCYLNNNFHADHDCSLHGHNYGFITNDGQLWSFTVNNSSESLLNDQDIRGRTLKVDGSIFYSAHFIEMRQFELYGDN